jgi:hypothetical protein
VEEAELGVLLGFLLSAILGFTILRAAPMHESCAPGPKNPSGKGITEEN